MHSVMSFHASSVSQEQLGGILRDYLALDRARIIRRLMLARCGALALGAGALETVVHGFSPIARVLTVSLCLVPPTCAWVVELAHARRLLRGTRMFGGRA